jgi:hypothetical protein
MNEKEYKELLEEVKSLRNQISRLTRRLEFYEYLFQRYGFPPFPPLDEEEVEIWLKRWKKYIQGEGISIDKWIKTHKEEIKSISRTFREHEISPQDATLYSCFRLEYMATYLASKSLLGSCECGGQLQLLVKDNTVYLTCAKCGRWLWQGLKHE